MIACIAALKLHAFRWVTRAKRPLDSTYNENIMGTNRR